MKKFVSYCFLFGLLICIISCQKEEFSNESDAYLKSNEIGKKEIIAEARGWFENNPGQNQYILFESAKDLKWDNAVINDLDSVTIVEIPVKLKENIKVKVIDSVQLNVEHRLLIFKEKDTIYSLMEYFISEKDLEYLQDVEKIKYSKRDNVFEGVVVLVDACGDVVSSEWITKKLKSASSLTTTYSGFCVGEFYVNPDGSLEWIRTLYCVVAEDSQPGGGGGSGGSSGSNPPSVENCGCDICTVCGGCTTVPTYSGEPSNIPEGQTSECPMCECSNNPDCGMANSVGINCDVLLAFEQDYKQKMSVSESIIFENMSRVQQISYLANAQFATWESERRYPESLYNGKGDAFRHAYWNAANVIDLGATLAESLATAHEDKPSYYYFNYKENEMDLFNNNVGRGLWNFWTYHFSSLEECIENAIVTGKLKYLNNLAPDGTATKNSQLIPTNQ